VELDDGRRKEGLVAPAQGALRPALRGRSACAPPRGRSKVVNKSIVLRTHLLSPRLCVLMTKHSWLARGASVRVRLRPFPLPFAPLCLFSLSLCPLSLILWSLACSPNMQRVVQRARSPRRLISPLFLWSPTSLSGQRADPTVAARNMDIVNHDMRAFNASLAKLELRLALVERRRSDANCQAVVLLVCLLLPVISWNFEDVKEISLSLMYSGVAHMSVFFYSVVQLWLTAKSPPPKAL
jgi:hypothetical protein